MIHCSTLLIVIGNNISLKRKNIMVWKKFIIKTIGTRGDYSKEGSKKYKKKIIDVNRFAAKFHIKNIEEDIAKIINKDKNDEEVVNNN